MKVRDGLGLLCLLLGGCAAEPVSPAPLPTVALENVRFGPDGALVEWVVFEATIRCAPDEVLRVTRFSLEREDIASGTRTLIAEALPPSARTYIDRDLGPGCRYRYRLTTHFSSGKGVQETDPFEVTPAWTFEFRSPARPRDASKGMVFVRIKKFERGVGLVEASHIHFDGDHIGWWEDAPGTDPVPRHRVTRPGGQAITIDFNTGALLKSVVPARKVVEVKRCKPIYELRTGVKLGCDVVVEQRKMDTYEISYRDSAGEHQVHVPKPDSLNQLCPDHQANPNAAPGESRLLEARSLLDEADRLWPIDSAASIKLYQRLKKDYGDMVIRLQVRNKVEGRARQADD